MYDNYFTVEELELSYGSINQIAKAKSLTHVLSSSDQKLENGDYGHRIQFVANMMEKMKDDPEFFS